MQSCIHYLFYVMFWLRRFIYTGEYEQALMVEFQAYNVKKLLIE